MRAKTLGKLFSTLIALGTAGLGVAQTWTSQDIGNPGVPGSTDDPNGAVRTIVGGGNDIWNNADNFHFNWTKVIGAFDIQVRVQSLEMANTWSKAGIFARETLEPGSRNVGVLVTPTAGQNLFNMQWRDTTNGGSGSKPSAERFKPVPYPNAWIRLVRPDANSNEFICYIDQAGASSTTPTWTEYHRHTIPGELLPETLYVGLGVTSHDNTKSTTAVFSDIKFNEGAFVPAVAPAIVQGPSDATVEEGSPATFSVTINDAEVFPPPAFQWQMNGEDIPGATSSTLTIDRAKLDDNGAKIRVVVSNVVGTATSDEVTLTVVADTTPPTLDYATGSISFTQVKAVFSEPLDPATAENPANYALSGGVTITEAKLAAPAGTPGDHIVLLTTSQQTPGTTLTLTVNNITDVAGNPVAPGSSVEFGTFKWQEGVVLHEFWQNVSGGLDGLKNDPRYPNEPSWTGLEPRTEYPRDGANEGGSNYGNRLSCWVVPQQTGKYVFFVSSDDPSELYLSPDADPANAVLIARQQGWTNPRVWRTANGAADPFEMNSYDALYTTGISQWPDLLGIQLQAGQKYYLYAIHTEGGGGDNLAVTMVTEDEFFAGKPQDGDAPTLEGALVGTYIDPNTQLRMVTQPTDQVAVLAGEGVTILSQDFNSSDGGFTVVNTDPAPPGPWVYDSVNGQWVADGSEDACTGPYNSQLNTPPITLSAAGSVTLNFRHRYSFEGDLWDAGMVRVSVNGGAFTPVPAENFTANGYAAGAIIGNGIAKGLRGFNGESPGYAAGEFITSTALLGNFQEGDTIVVQFVGAWDECASGAHPNWVIDQVELSLGKEVHPVTFAAEAEATLIGEPVPVSYQWQRNDGAGYQDIPGATGSSYTFYPVQEDFNALFRLVVTVPTDPSKSLISDEVKLLTEPQGPPTIAISAAGGTITIEYTGTLQSADQVTGPYTEVPGASSPYTAPADAPAKFYRTVR